MKPSFPPSVPFEETSRILLRDSEVATMYLEESLADGDMELLMLAIEHLADARLGSMTALVEATGLSREALYRTLSEGGNPRLDTLTRVLNALGLRMAVTPQV